MSKTGTADSDTFGGDTGGRGGKRWSSRLAPYTPPWLIWVGSWPLALLLWAAWGDDYTARPWYALGAFAATGLAARGTWKYARARGELIQILATSSAVLVGVWLLFGALLGPTVRPLVDLWGGVGLAVCAFWSIRRALMGSGDRVVAATGPAGKLVEALKGARLSNPKVLDGGVVEARVEADRGSQTIADVQQQIPVMEAAVPGLRKGALRVVQDPADAGAGTLVAVPVDPLAGEQAWPGPSAPGASAHLGVPIGPYDVGGLARLYVTGDDAAGRALAHFLVMGMPGTGKSSGVKVAVADLLTRCDFVCWAHDHVKGLQTLAPVLDGLDWVTMDLKAGRVMLAEVRKAIRARTDHLGRLGKEQWEEGCGLSLLMVWIEEATDLADLDVLTQLVREARSVGIVIFISIQRAAHTSMDTDTRAQLAGSWCFGVRDDTDAGFALPDWVLEAGAAPEDWAADHPGYCYLVGPGVPKHLASATIRTYRATPEQLRAAVALGEQYRQPLDQVTTAALSAAYQQRPDPASFLDTVPARQPATTPVRSAAVGNLLDDEDDDDLDDEGLEPMPPELDPDVPVDPNAPVTVLPDIALGDPSEGRPKLSTEQARAVVQQHLGALWAAGERWTKPSNIAAMKPQTTMTREWVRKELVRLADHAGPTEWGLTRNGDDPPGTYQILAPATPRELAEVYR